MNKDPNRTDRIVITGMGLVSALGLSAASSVAAIRGGIANFFEHESVLVNDNAYGTELAGAKIARLPGHAVSRHLHGRDRAAALLAQALRQCTDGLDHSLFPKALCRLGCGNGLQEVELAELIDTSLRPLISPAVQANDAGNAALGRCRFFQSIIEAVADLRKEITPMVIVGCVDSLCDDPILEKLLHADRLKSGSAPEGIVAGEAAGVFLLELESRAASRGAGVFAYLCTWGGGIEPVSWTGNIPSTARGLRNAFEEAFSSLPGKGEEIDMVIADLNGERPRSYEWAVTTSTIFPRSDKVRELNHPADCTGDCGTAMGAVLLATAIEFMSGPQPPVNVALCISDDAGARRVLCLQKGTVSAETMALESRPKGSAVVPVVIEQHCNEASFLWLVRRNLAKAPHCDLQDLMRHDGRIEAHLGGLYQAGEAGWDISRDSLVHGDAAEYFAASFLAFKSGSEDRIGYVLEKAGTDGNLYKGVASALGWLSYGLAEPHIKRLLAADPPLHRLVGVIASALHRRDPGQFLNNAAFDSAPMLQARALRAYGELGRNGEMSLYSLQSFLAAEDGAVRFWASWSAALLGDKRAVEVLKDFVLSDSGFGETALNIALRRLELKSALAWQQDLGKIREARRSAVIAAGIIGDAVVVPWLLEQMTVPALARVAGEAFTTITGVDIGVTLSEGIPPEDFDAGPNDDPKDTNVAMDPDRYLPWPDVEEIAVWWEKNKGSYPGGIRRLLGKPIGADHLEHLLRAGRQTVRAAAALELTIRLPGRPLLEVRAPAFRQRCWATQRS